MSVKFLLVLLLAVIVYRYWRRFERGFRAAARSQARPASFGPDAPGQGSQRPNAEPHARQAAARAPVVVQDLVPCPACGSYIAPDAACNCTPMEQRRRG